MAVLIDPPSWPAHGRRWSHLVSDVSLGELHAFAGALGVPARGFEGDHYDVPEERYAAAVGAGAIPVSSRELLRRLQASGLRRPKRRGEKVLASRVDEPAGVRVDVLLSAMAPTAPLAGLHVLAVWGPALLVLPDGEGYRLPHADGPLASAAAVVVAAREVVVDLVGRRLPAGHPVPTLQQVGYTRTVPVHGGRAAAAEPVLRWSAGDSARPPPPARRGAWVDGHQAGALLPPHLGALARAVLGG